MEHQRLERECFQLACGASDIAFDTGRAVELKGLSGTYTVHPVRWLQA